MAHQEERSPQRFLNPLIAMIANEIFCLVWILTIAVDECEAKDHRQDCKCAKQNIWPKQDSSLLVEKLFVVVELADVFWGHFIPIDKVIRPIQGQVEDLLTGDEKSTQQENGRVKVLLAAARKVYAAQKDYEECVEEEATRDVDNMDCWSALVVLFGEAAILHNAES